MAKYSGEGFCPNDIVTKALMKNDDRKLYGLWSIIGSSVVCISDSNNPLSVEQDTVVEMLTIDPISLRLMKSIICYNGRAKRVQIVKGHKKAGPSELCSSTIQEVLVSGELINPCLVLEDKSNFAVILSENSKRTTIFVHMWDLRVLQ